MTHTVRAWIISALLFLRPALHILLLPICSYLETNLTHYNWVPLSEVLSQHRPYRERLTICYIFTLVLCHDSCRLHCNVALLLDKLIHKHAAVLLHVECCTKCTESRPCKFFQVV